MDLSAAITVMEAMRWTPMTPLEMQDMEQFRFADPKPTYKDITQILSMLERFRLVKREGIGDSTTSDWRLSPEGRQIGSVEQLSEYIHKQLSEVAELDELEAQLITCLGEMGGRSDLPSLRGRLGMMGGSDSDHFFQALAELQALGLLVVGWGQTERDFPFLRLTRRGWFRAVDGA